ncbi:CLUMA_CG004517, isoform A [Clunio marinus]|uniref:CLUMA_CG004517, isoform A n=1 Tax=Clunio marinus TaxID=568069 RepID=A0A1J1HS70_9DIPT|nr:CLUMA_CG004517, isoform A [Clunio marinus]
MIEVERSTLQAKESEQFKGERKLKMKKFIAIGLGLTGLAYLSYQLYNLWKQSEEQDEMDEFIKIIKDWKVNQKLFNKRKNFPSNGFELDLWQPLAEEDEEIEEELEVEVEEENNMMNFDEEVNYHLYRNRRYYPTLNFNRELELIEEDDYWDDLDVDFEEFF